MKEVTYCVRRRPGLDSTSLELLKLCDIGGGASADRDPLDGRGLPVRLTCAYIQHWTSCALQQSTSKLTSFSVCFSFFPLP